MTKKEKNQKINDAFSDGFRVYAKNSGGVQLEVSGTCFDGEKIFGFVKKSDSDAYQRVDVTEMETYKYFLESICGATTEGVEG